MTHTLIARAMVVAYPKAIKQDADGFYWINADGDRFTFATFNEAAEDLATDIGVGLDEAREVIAAGRATR